MAGALAAPFIAAGCSNTGTTGSPKPEETGPVTIRFMWWGNDTRLKLTTQVIEGFQKKYPNITVKAEPGEFASYWDKLSTMIAGGNAPDVIQMDEKYINEYSSRGALMDLGQLGVATGKFAPGTLDPGKYKGKLYGLNAGINAPIVVANPKVFSAAGATIPDDATWNWETYRKVVKEITAKGAGAYFGSHNLASVDSMLKLWVRQQGKEQFSETGIAYGAEDVESFWQLMLDMQKEGGFPTAQQTAEDEGKSLDQSFMGAGKLGLASLWSNQITAMDKATGQDLKLLRPPSKTGKASDAQLWLKASMYWSAFSKTKHPDAVKKLIDYLANDVEAGKVLGTERGIPANTDVKAAIAGTLNASDKKVFAYLDKIGPELGKPAPVPPPGGGQSPAIQLRNAQNVLFGRATPAVASKAFVDEVKAAIKV